MRVLIIIGSSSVRSSTRIAAQFFEQRLNQIGAKTSLLDLAAICTEVQQMEHYYAPPVGSQTAILRAAVANSDAVLLASPVHHASFSGLLKSGLDHLAPHAFSSKPIGIFAMSGNVRSASAACDQMRGVVRALGGWSTPTHVGLCNDDLVEGVIVSEMVSRIDSMCLELISFPGNKTTHELKNSKITGVA
jgi:NAD(P)H-dependent FMN reductase